MRNLIDPNQISESFQEAANRAADFGRDAQERAQQIGRDARDAQERALALARLRAYEARERAREAAEAMPPGLLVRLGSSIVGIPLLLILVFAEGPARATALPFTVAVAICASVGGYEYFRGLRLRGFRPTDGPAFVAIALLQFAAWGVSRGLLTEFLPALLAMLVIATLIHQILRRDPEPVSNIGVTFLGVVYVGWLFSYLIFLRSLPGTVSVWPFTPAPRRLSGFVYGKRGVARFVCHGGDMEYGCRGVFCRNALWEDAPCPQFIAEEDTRRGDGRGDFCRAHVAFVGDVDSSAVVALLVSGAGDRGFGAGRRSCGIGSQTRLGHQRLRRHHARSRRHSRPL